MSVGPEKPQPTWRRTVARAVIVLGAVLVGGMLARSAPKEQTLVFRLPAERLIPKELSATWTKAGETEPFGGVTLQLSSPVPREVRHSVSLPNGDYVLAFELRGAETAHDVDPETRTERRVTLEGGETVIYLGRPGN